MTTKKLSWSDPQALRALADMQRRIAADMRDLACRMAMESVAAETEELVHKAELKESDSFEETAELYYGGGSGGLSKVNSP